MSAHLLQFVLVMWAAAFAATMGWAASLAAPAQENWTDERTWGMR